MNTLCNSAYSRAVGAIEGHTGNALYYFQYLFTKDNLVWMALLPFALGLSVYNAVAKRSHADTLLIVWVFVVFGVFTLAQTKLYWYVLPALPAFALAIGNLLYGVFRKISKNRGKILSLFGKRSQL